LTALGHETPPPNNGHEKGSTPGGRYERGMGPLPEVNPNPTDPHPVDNPGENAVDNPRKGSESVRDPRVTADAFTTSITPLQAPTRPCGKHLDKPHANCRGCGTTKRQQQQASEQAAAETARAQSLAETAAWRAERAQPPAPPTHPAYTAARGQHAPRHTTTQENP